MNVGEQETNEESNAWKKNIPKQFLDQKNKNQKGIILNGLGK